MIAQHSAAAPSQPASAPRGRLRRILLQLHLWTALVLCLPLVVLGVTGSLLVFQPEFENLLHPPPQRSVGTGVTRPVAEIIAAAQASVGTEYAPGIYIAPRSPDDPASLRFLATGRVPPDRRMIAVWVDPASLDILKQRYVTGSALRQVFLLHANLLMRDRSGRAFVGWLGVAMLALGVSGLVLWWPRSGRWRAAFVVKRGAHGLRLHRDLHGAVGIWGLIVFIAVSASGVYLAFPQTLAAAVTKVLPRSEARAAAAAPAPAAERVQGAQRIDADRAIAAALRSTPGAHLLSVALPSRSDQPYRVFLAPPGYGWGAPQIAAAVDPLSGDLLGLRDPRHLSAGDKLLTWLRPLHFGQGLGSVWRFLVFLSGFLPALFAVTGIAMWLIKRHNRRRSLSAGRPTAA